MQVKQAKQYQYIFLATFMYYLKNQTFKNRSKYLKDSLKAIRNAFWNFPDNRIHCMFGILAIFADC